MTGDDLAAKLRATFLQELEDQAAVMESSLLALESDPEDGEAIRTLFRAAHSLKGAARVAGEPLIEAGCHDLEAVVAAIRDGRRELSGGDFSLLFAVTDAFGEARRRLAAGRSLDGSALEALRAHLADAEAQAAGREEDGPPSSRGSPRETENELPPESTSEPAARSPVRYSGELRAETGATEGRRQEPETGAPQRRHPERDDRRDAGATQQGLPSAGKRAPDATSWRAGVGPPGGPEPAAAREAPEAPEGAEGVQVPEESAPAPAEVPPASPPAEGQRATSASVRVSADRLDDLVAHATDLLTTSGTIADHPHALAELRDEIARWGTAWRKQGRSPTSAAARDAHADLDRQLHQITAAASRLTRDAIDHARVLSRSTQELLAGVRDLRMRRFSEATMGLARAVRDVAAETGKEAQLLVEGEDVEADRMVIDALREPLLHLVRNAVDHGIERPDERESTGKPRQGSVRVTATLERGRLRVTVEDDGRGIDSAAIRRRLQARGETPPADARTLARRLLAGGITTREEATSISGRGIGLDVVAAAMERIGGTTALRWQEGVFCQFILESPPSPSTLRAVVAEVSEQLFALPIAEVERVVRIRGKQLREVDGRVALVLGEAPVPVATLSDLLGPPLRTRNEIDGATALVLRSGEDGLALVVDAVPDEREVVVRPLDRKAQVPHASGGAILPSGRIALVLVPRSLVEAGLERARAAVSVPEPAASAAHVLVVDDSITTRTLEQSVLEAAGYHVTAAVDGLDAWERITRTPPDLVVSDVEMPRMNGFELCRRIRNSKRFGDIPVILVTGMETAEDRALGLEAGADAYILKSSFDQATLLETIRQLID